MPKPLLRRVGHRAPSVRRTRGSNSTQTVRGAEFNPTARDVQIIDGVISVVGGDVHNHYQSNRRKGEIDIWAVLKSIPNFRKIHQDTLAKVTEGTGQWLLETEEFRIWMEGNGDIKILWGSGIAGAGKTLVASLVIEKLDALARADGRICVGYVYIRYSDGNEVTVRNILEILVKQAGERHPECVPLIKQIYAQHVREDTQPTELQLLDLLRNITKSMLATFFVLDALDEAPTAIQLDLLKKLSSLDANLFVTSRPLPSIEAHFPKAQSINIVAQDHDIDLHIAKEIENSPTLQDLLGDVGTPLRNEIVASIKERCGGMFLHASLQLVALRECASIQDMEDTLKDFPPHIEDVYLQTWNRILNQTPMQVSLAKAVLLWVLHAERSMNIEELRHAVATCPDKHHFEPKRLAKEGTLMAVCRGLVVVEEESRLVRLVHYTAKEALRRMLLETFPHPHAVLAATCTTHLADNGFQDAKFEFKEHLDAVLHADPLLAYAHEAWALHAKESLDLEAAFSRIKGFIAGCHAFPAIIYGQRIELLNPLHLVALSNLPLSLIGADAGDLDIPTKHHGAWALGLACWRGHYTMVQGLLHLCAEAPIVQSEPFALNSQGVEGTPVEAPPLANAGIHVNKKDKYGWTPLMRASSVGYVPIVELLLSRPDVDINIQSTNSGSSALIIACQDGHEDVIRTLLADPNTRINQADNDGWTPLMVACHNGHEGAVRALLAHCDTQINAVSNGEAWSALELAVSNRANGIVTRLVADPRTDMNLTHASRYSPLMVATENGDEAIVEVLLSHPDTEVNLMNLNGLSALKLASFHGQEGTAKLLLAHSAIDVNLQPTNDGWSALLTASQEGQEGVVKLLLAHPDIQVNLTSTDGWSALIIASYHGRDGPLKLLLSHPQIDVNALNDNGFSALMSALENGHRRCVELLLAHPNIQVNLMNETGWCALLQAARHGDPENFKLVLSHPDTQVNLQDDEGWSALMIAALAGHSDIIEPLLERPETLVNATRSNGCSALIMASQYGYDHSVDLLLTHPDIQVNMVDSNGWSALTYACHGGYQATVKALVGHRDIQVNLKDNDGWSALLYASRQGHSDVVTVLLAHADTDVNAASHHGSTALLVAAEHGYYQTVRLLLAVPDIDVNPIDGDGDTAIKMAAENGYEEIVSALLEVPGINVTVASSQSGHTALSGAMENGHNKVVRLIQDFASKNGITIPIPVTPECESEEEGFAGASDSDADSDGLDAYQDALESL